MMDSNSSANEERSSSDDNEEREALDTDILAVSEPSSKAKGEGLQAIKLGGRGKTVEIDKSIFI